MTMIEKIEIKNFRIHEKTKIENIGSFLTLVGKNNVGKSSVLLALQELFSSNYEIKDIDKKDGSKPVTISVKFDDGSIIDLSSANKANAVNFFYFSADQGLNNNFDGKTIAELIKEHRDNTQNKNNLSKLKEQIKQIINLFTYINDLTSLLDQHSFLKDIVDDFMGDKYTYKDIHKLIVYKESIYDYLSKNKIDKFHTDLFNNIFNIIDKFEVDFRSYGESVDNVDEKTNEAMSDFYSTGDSTFITDIDEISCNAEYEEEISGKYDTDWFDDFKTKIKQAFFHGDDEIAVADDFFLENMVIMIYY